jgi:tRNA-splicing ligase RtcB
LGRLDGIEAAAHIDPSVLEAVGDTVRILHRLTPVGVAMAGANEFDPYKD